MRILYLAQFAGSNKHGMGLAQFSLAREWRRMGCEVEIVAASFSHARVSQPESGLGSENIDGVTYRWIPVKPYKSMVGRIWAMLQYTFAVLNLYSKVQGQSPQVVIFSSYHPFIFCAMKVLKRIPAGALSVVEVRDLWGESLKYLVEGASGGLSRITSFIVSKLEDYSYRNADLVVSSLINFPKYAAVRKLQLDSRNFLWVRNAVAPMGLSMKEDDSLRQALSAAEKMRQKAKVLMVYSGSVGRATGFEAVLQFLRKHAETGLIVVGGGDRRSHLYEMAESMGVASRVTMLPPMERNALKELIALSDLCVCTYRASPLYRYGVSPTKLGDYLQAGKPILYSGNAPLGIPETFYIHITSESELEVRGKLELFSGEHGRVLAREILEWTKSNFTAEIEAQRYLVFLAQHYALRNRTSLNVLPVVE